MKNLFKIFKSTFKISPTYYILMILNIFSYALSSLILVYTPNLIISKLESGETFKNVIIYSLIIVLINAGISIFNKFMTYLINYRQSYVSRMYYYLMADKILSISYENLEDPHILDLKERALFAAENQGAIIRVLTSILSLIQNIVTIITLVTIMAQLGGILILVVSSYLVIYIVMSLLTMFIQMRFIKEIVPINRKFGYYMDTLSNPNCVKDYRIYNAGELVLSRTDKFQAESTEKIGKFYNQNGLIQASSNSLRGGIQGLVYLYIAKKMFDNVIKASSFSLYTSSALSFITESASLVTNVTELYQSLYYMAPFMEVLSIPDEKTIGSHIEFQDEIEEIEFKNVSFTYPRQTREVLSNLSFKIEKGECISIVGLNGAGKSTLIKLLCRLYKPTKGEILINGININEYDIDSYNKHISCVFQDYKLFGYSIKDNITSGGTDTSLCNRLIEELGLKEKIDSLDYGIDTYYNKQLDEEGIELSGGQSQKIAIARALYKNSELVILDEPTSALDPKSEADIYENFNRLTKNKTAIYISHRMSSSTFCDKILVIDGGVITDFDSHQNLMKKDCLYRTLFNKQAINYKD